MLHSEMSVFYDIPENYSVHARGRISFIVKRGFEWIAESGGWENPDLILSMHGSEKIKGGRGRAVLVDAGEGKGIFFKKMVHGGILGSLLGDAFTAKRIIGNLKHASSLRKRNIASPDVITIILRQKLSFLFEGYVGVEWMEDAESLIQMVKKKKREEKTVLLKAVAMHLWNFHEQGFSHKDLNGGNVLIRIPAGKEPEVLFIDLDTMKYSRKVGRMKRMKNIFRLFRSLRKSAGRGNFSDSDEESFIQAYCRDDGRMLSLVNAFLPLYRIMLLFHILFWKLSSKND